MLYYVINLINLSKASRSTLHVTIHSALQLLLRSVRRLIKKKRESNNGDEMQKSYLLEHSRRLGKKYPGKCVAFVNGELVAVGEDGLEVFKKAKEKYPEKEISIAYIPTKEETVTFL